MNTPDARTRLLLHGPIAPTLLRLAVPNVLVMVSQAAVGLLETYFIGQLGTAPLAGMALVFPVFMLMQMTSAGAIGGGIASSIARARGAGRHDAVAALVMHALAIAAVLGLASSALMLAGGRWVYASMGGEGQALEAALQYSNVAFGCAIVVWLFNALAACLRGTGDMGTPAAVTVGGLVVLVPLSPLLIFGWGPVPAYGIAGGALAIAAYYVLGTAVLLACMHKRGLLPTAKLARFRFERALASQILGVGLLSAVGTLCTNLSIMLATGYVGLHGVPALAGYGTASRLEYLLVPLVFGLGAPLLTLVGTCVGAGDRERALRAAWIGAAMVFAVTESLGLLAALFAREYMQLFTTDPGAIAAGAQYLHIVGPCYGLFGGGLALYFASQGSGRMRWPLLASFARVVVIGAGGWMAVKGGAGLGSIYAMHSLSLAAYAVLMAWSVAGGAWFGRPGMPLPPARLVRRLAP